MAVGDKKPVVMEADRAVPGGIATLGTDGKLASEQIPGLEALGAIEYINNLPFTRKNLLDNWYFADPIDQRGGYLVPPNTPYYEHGQYPTVAGYTTTYMQTTPTSSEWTDLVIDGVTFSTPFTNAVHGYTGSGHAIDRWIVGLNQTLLIKENCVSISSQSTDNWLHQGFETPTRYVGNILTASSLVTAQASGRLRFMFSDHEEPNRWGDSGWTEVGFEAGETKILTFTKEVTRGASCVIFQPMTTDVWFDIHAAKLELGSTQTLAHQDENGNWVLNDPPPNKALELAKCQRYYQLFSSADTRPENLADYRPTMRANPALGTININGQTMYFADANL